jgi:integrator complex subunit 11
MTYPTRAIAPVLLEDYQHLLRERPGTGPVFGRHHIAPCMAKVHVLDLQAAVKVGVGVCWGVNEWSSDVF